MKLISNNISNSQPQSTFGGMSVEMLGESHNQVNHNHDFSYQTIFERHTTNEAVIEKQAKWLGKSRQECQRLCQQYKHNMVHFAAWLAIPKLGLLLVFHNNVCVEVNEYNDLCLSSTDW